MYYILRSRYFHQKIYSLNFWINCSAIGCKSHVSVSDTAESSISSSTTSISESPPKKLLNSSSKAGSYACIQVFESVSQVSC